MLFQRGTSILSASIMKSTEKKLFMQYMLLKLIVYVLLQHVSVPVVNMTNVMRLTTLEYLFIADCR